MYILREIERKDLSIINKWEKSVEFIELLDVQFHGNSKSVTEKWLEHVIENNGNAIRCVIMKKDTNEIAGLVSLTTVDYINQSAEIRIMIKDSEKDKKSMETYAINAMLYHAFFNMNLKRVEWDLLDGCDHESEKHGFQYEGRKRNAKYVNGTYVDLLVYSVLRDDYKKIIDIEEDFNKISTYSISTVTTYDEIHAIIKKCDNAFKNPVTQRERYPNLLSKIHKNAHVLVAYQSDILGYCAIYANDFENGVAYITLIAVKPEAQHMHIGKKLLRKSLDLARTYGMTSCVLEVKKDNVSAIRFYKANGFSFFNESDTSYFMKRKLSMQA